MTDVEPFAVELLAVEGTGNTFLLADQRGSETFLQDLEALRVRASDWCAAEGVDGLLVIGPAPEGGPETATMVVLNRDGSRPEMCGNGLRCVAAHVGRDAATRPFEIRSDAGLHRCTVLHSTAHDADVRVELGPARHQATMDWQPPLPAAASSPRRFERVSMGNPHAVHFANEHEDVEHLADTLGREIEFDPAFAPERTNVEFARLTAAGSLDLAVWERGVGRTEACGTGAAATAFAAARTGLVPWGSEVCVAMRGGDLWIGLPADKTRSISLRGTTSVLRRG